MSFRGVSDADTYFVPDNEMGARLNSLGKLYATDKERAKREFERLVKANTGYFVKRRDAETKLLTGKALFERRLDRIPAETAKKYVAGDITVSDYAIYSIKQAASTHIVMFNPGDNADSGVCNINGSQLPNESVMLVTSIALLSGIGAGATVEDGKIVDFGKIHPIIANGTFSFECGQKKFYSDSSNDLFNRDASKDTIIGEYRLEAPKLLTPNNNIKFNLDIPTGLPANTFVKVLLKGMITMAK